MSEKLKGFERRADKYTSWLQDDIIADFCAVAAEAEARERERCALIALARARQQRNLAEQIGVINAPHLSPVLIEATVLEDFAAAIRKGE